MTLTEDSVNVSLMSAVGDVISALLVPTALVYTAVCVSMKLVFNHHHSTS